MKLKLLINIILTICLTSSCKSILESVYGMNKKFEFTSKSAYVKYLENKKGLDISRVIYPDSGSRVSFLNAIQQGEFSVYYGSLLNDSIELIRSDILNENISCMGRIINEMNSGISGLNLSDSGLLANSELKNYTFRYIADNKIFDLNNSEKRMKIIMLYSFSLGRYFDNTFKEVQKFHVTHKDVTELIIISLDDVQSLPL